MTTRRVPLRVWVNGKKRDIGEAVVDTADGYLDISATVTDPEWRRKLTQNSGFSVHFEPNQHSKTYEVEDVAMISTQSEALKIRGRGAIPHARFADGTIHHAP